MFAAFAKQVASVEPVARNSQVLDFVDTDSCYFALHCLDETIELEGHLTVPKLQRSRWRSES